MKNEGFSTSNIRVITPKTEGCKFPWYIESLGHISNGCIPYTQILTQSLHTPTVREVQMPRLFCHSSKDLGGAMLRKMMEDARLGEEKTNVEFGAYDSNIICRKLN